MQQGLWKILKFLERISEISAKSSQYIFKWNFTTEVSGGPIILNNKLVVPIVFF